MRSRGLWTSALAGLAAFLTGCATPAARKLPEPVFFPRPPAEPRLQYLTGISSEGDLGGGPSRFTAYIVGTPPAQHPILKPYGLAFKDHQLFVCDTGLSGIDILDFDKKTLRYFTPAHEGQLYTPVNIAVDHDGTRYVADSARGQVLIFGADGQYRAAMGDWTGGTPARSHMGGASAAPAGDSNGQPAEGNGVGQMKPTDVVIAGDRLYVTDLKGHCVRVYNKESRRELFTVPRDAAPDDKRVQLYSPVNMALDAKGRLYVCDIGAFRVQQYDQDGHYLKTFGAGVGDRPGEFARPKGVAVDRDGRLYVVDAAAQVVQMFDEDGKLLMYFGEPGGSEASLDLPAKVIVDYDHVDLFRKYAAPGFQVDYLVLVTSQYGPRKVRVYGFGHRK